MITEDYVSFETAKLLKEKGFDEPTFWFYVGDGTKLYAHKIAGHDWWRRPTLQMAMKWLREVHNLFIEISVNEMLRDKGYQWALYYNNTKEIMPYSGWGNTYEESCESAIKYCLENLV